MFAPAVVDLPLDLPAPLRLIGREQVRAYRAAGATVPLEMTAGNVVVYHTVEPDVVIADFEFDAPAMPTGIAGTLGEIMDVRASATG